MKNATFLLALLSCQLVYSGANALTLSEADKKLAREEFDKSAKRPCIPNYPCFKIRNDYPSQVKSEVYPWKGIEYSKEPEKYLARVLEYVLEGNVETDWALQSNTVRNWYHAVWMHSAREPIRGLTKERGSRWHELSVDQTRKTNNWAVGFYNSPGGLTFGQVWMDKTQPDTRKVNFPEGTVSAKLLFTDATDVEAPFLVGSNLEWEADINDDGKPIKFRLLQVDVAIKDRANGGFNGWVFGTFYFDGSLNNKEYWKNLVPVGVEWGTSPQFTRLDFAKGKLPPESWVNPVAEKKFAGRAPDGKLGYLGRMNGPVDDPRSSCLACHSRAMDMAGPTEPALIPPLDANRIREIDIDGNKSYQLDLQNGSVKEDEVRYFFRNLKVGESYDGVHNSLDYSLQLMKGVGYWNVWIGQNIGTPIKPKALRLRHQRQLMIPARRGESRGD